MNILIVEDTRELAAELNEPMSNSIHDEEFLASFGYNDFVDEIIFN